MQHDDRKTKKKVREHLLAEAVSRSSSIHSWMTFFFPALSRTQNCIAVAISLAALFGTSLNIGPLNAEGSTNRFIAAIAVPPSENLVLLLELAFILLIVRCFIGALSKKRSFDLPCLFLSVFFAFAMVFGKTCESFGDPWTVFDGLLGTVATVISLASFACLGYMGFAFLFSLIDAASNFDSRETIDAVRPRNRALSFFESHPILAPSCMLGVAWLPLLIAFFPGLFAPGDTLNQISQFFGLPEATSASIILVDQNVTLNAHHPVVHTLLMGGSVLLGQTVFGSCSIGYFLYIMGQYLVTIITIGYGLNFLKQCHVPGKIRIGLLLFVALFPWFPEYALLGTKDTLFACSLLLLSISLFRIGSKTYEMAKKDWVILVISLLGFCLLKKGYVVFALIIMVFALLKASSASRKVVFCTFIGPIAISILLSNVVFPALSVTSGSSREMLSIPAQQVARCVNTFGDEITSVQKDAIDKVFDYETMQNKYNPLLSDPVKNTFNKHATSDDIKAFLAVWRQLLAEHTGTCLAATMMNYYGYFYPTEANPYNYNLETSRESIENVSSIAPFYDFQHSDSVFTAFVSKSFTLYQALWNNAPLLSLFTQGSTYIWALLILIGYHARKKYRSGALLVLLPTLLVLCITMIGPCNFIVRYTFPIAFVIPFFIALLWNRQPTTRRTPPVKRLS